MDTTTHSPTIGTTGEGGSIATALDVLDNVAREKPELLRETMRSVTSLVDGLQCATEEDGWTVTTDLPDTIGGQGAGPTPGMLGRAALGVCLTMGYQLRAVRLGVELTSLSVSVEADSDADGMLSMDCDARPGYSEVRYHVDVVSSATDELIHQMLDEGDVLSPYRDVFANATSLKRTESIQQPGS